MKKLFLTLATSSLIFLTQAQEFGFKAGYNLSTETTQIGNHMFDEPDYKSGYQVGVTSDFKLNEKFYFSPSLLWITKGSQHNTELYAGEALGEIGKSKTNYRVNYIELPLLVTYKMNTGKVKPIFQAGPSVSYLVNTVEKMSWGNNSTVRRYDNSNNNPFELGMTAGLGVEISKFQFIANYDYGLTSITKSSNASLKNKSWQLSAVYFFTK